MSDCKCGQCGCNHGVGVILGSCITNKCKKVQDNVRIYTKTIQTTAGTDAEGQPFEPKFGAYTNTVVKYLANGAVYLYDSTGEYTHMNANATLAEGVEELQKKLTQDVTYLQTNINQLANKEAQDMNNLQANINVEVNARTEQVNNLLTEIAGKQDALVSGTNIKTINGQSILGEGNVNIASGGATEVPTASYTADNISLAFGDETVELTPAVGTAGGAVSKSGIMSAFQASQLEALASAYEAEEKGTVLYEGTASVNNIELSESGLSYDHLIVVAQYMGTGSAAIEQQVSQVFYPTDSVKAFQMNATDVTTGNTPMVQLLQDIWHITDDGMELELVMSQKATVNSETVVEPEQTSYFTITKVVGFGKKLAEAQEA